MEDQGWALAHALRGLGGTPGQPGTVHLVGGGPGDPGLLTLRAAVLIASADVVAHDRLSPPEVLSLARPDAELVMVGKRYGETGTSRADVDALLADRAAAGKVVVRLKGGDPFVFGRGGEEAEALYLAGIPFEVVSGVTSPVAVPGAAGIPVTHRGIAAGFAVVTGHEDPTKPAGHVDYTTLGPFPGTLLFLMGVNHLPDICRNLLVHGKDASTPVAVVRWGTTPRQLVARGTLDTIVDEVQRIGLRSPAVTVVGDVAGLSPVLDWRSRRELQGVSVLVPRTREQASALSMRVRTLGGEAVEAPTIAVEPGDVQHLDRALVELADGRFVGVCLTSPNGVRALASSLARNGRDARALAGVQWVACVGPGTAAALREELAVDADLVASVHTTAGLAADLPVGDGGAVLLPRADLATETLADGLTAKGWTPVGVDAYRTTRPADLPPGVRERLAAGDVDLVAFASSSTVRNFVDLLADTAWDARVVSIGPVTSATCRELGLEVAVEADPHDLDGLAAALVEAAERG